MKAVAYRTKGDPHVLVDIDLPCPAPGPRDLLCAVSAMVDHGLIKSTLSHVVNGPINAENLRKAHEIVEVGRTIGKVVVVDIR